MNISQKLLQSIEALPESKQQEIFDFVEYLRQKAEREENGVWSDLSIESAMQGMETEDSPYLEADIKEYYQ